MNLQNKNPWAEPSICTCASPHACSHRDGLTSPARDRAIPQAELRNMPTDMQAHLPYPALPPDTGTP
ncbi:hypothetical protein CesoFtcFv8_019282 [Champsocephalus esox]|uniref:Uncharacterized protein n=1 Tax=Champsocephalus esox TaxID=159716 RepID=A0AAN8BIQ1_9TELE|nr:hypothetical protein CesoFtcFv8_019282 [Champsocephalus esox]